MTDIKTSIENKIYKGCVKCSDQISSGQAFELGKDRTWHIDCFACYRCSTQLSVDSNFLILDSGALLCYECSDKCKKCGKKINGTAIILSKSNDTYCHDCFICYGCKEKIADLKYAKTKHGLFCLKCHEQLLIKRKEYEQEKLNKSREKTLTQLKTPKDTIIKAPSIQINGPTESLNPVISSTTLASDISSAPSTSSTVNAKLDSAGSSPNLESTSSSTSIPERSNKRPPSPSKDIKLINPNISNKNTTTEDIDIATTPIKGKTEIHVTALPNEDEIISRGSFDVDNNNKETVIDNISALEAFLGDTLIDIADKAKSTSNFKGTLKEGSILTTAAKISRHPSNKSSADKKSSSMRGPTEKPSILNPNELNLKEKHSKDETVKDIKRTYPSIKRTSPLSAQHNTSNVTKDIKMASKYYDTRNAYSGSLVTASETNSSGSVILQYFDIDDSKDLVKKVSRNRSIMDDASMDLRTTASSAETKVDSPEIIELVAHEGLKIHFNSETRSNLGIKFSSKENTPDSVTRSLTAEEDYKSVYNHYLTGDNLDGIDEIQFSNNTLAEDREDELSGKDEYRDQLGKLPLKNTDSSITKLSNSYSLNVKASKTERESSPLASSPMRQAFSTSAINSPVGNISSDQDNLVSRIDQRYRSSESPIQFNPPKTPQKYVSNESSPRPATTPPVRRHSTSDRHSSPKSPSHRHHGKSTLDATICETPNSNITISNENRSIKSSGSGKHGSMAEVRKNKTPSNMSSPPIKAHDSSNSFASGSNQSPSKPQTPSHHHHRHHTHHHTQNQNNNHIETHQSNSNQHYHTEKSSIKPKLSRALSMKAKNVFKSIKNGPTVGSNANQRYFEKRDSGDEPYTTLQRPPAISPYKESPNMTKSNSFNLPRRRSSTSNSPTLSHMNSEGDLAAAANNSSKNETTHTGWGVTSNNNHQATTQRRVVSKGKSDSTLPLSKHNETVQVHHKSQSTLTPTSSLSFNMSKPPTISTPSTNISSTRSNGTDSSLPVSDKPLNSKITVPVTEKLREEELEETDDGQDEDLTAFQSASSTKLLSAKDSNGSGKNSESVARVATTNSSDVIKVEESDIKPKETLRTTQGNSKLDTNAIQIDISDSTLSNVTRQSTSKLPSNRSEVNRKYVINESCTIVPGSKKTSHSGLDPLKSNASSDQSIDHIKAIKSEVEDLKKLRELLKTEVFQLRKERDNLYSDIGHLRQDKLKVVLTPSKRRDDDDYVVVQNGYTDSSNNSERQHPSTQQTTPTLSPFSNITRSNTKPKFWKIFGSGGNGGNTRQQMLSPETTPINNISKISSPQKPTKLEISGPIIQQKTKDTSKKENNKLAVPTNLKEQFGGVQPPIDITGEQLYKTSLISRCNYENRDVPLIVSTCINYIESNEEYLKTKGIYRKAGSQVLIEEIERNFAVLKKDDKVTDTLNELLDQDIHAVSSTLKRYLRKLYDPVLSFIIYEPLITFVRYNELEKQLPLTMNEDDMLKNKVIFKNTLHAFVTILKRLPKEHIALLKVIAKHLNLIVQHNDSNLMTLYNISVVFGPGLMRDKEGEKDIIDLKLKYYIIGFIIENYKVIFHE